MQRIIIVDDHPTVADTLQYWLKSQDNNLDPVVAHSVVQALELLAHDSNFDLILLDYDMQPTNGLEGMKAIQKLYPNIDIAIFSGGTEVEVIDRCLQLGSRGWLPKAMESKPLLQAVKLILAGERFVPFDQMKEIAALNENPILSKLTSKEREIARILAEGVGDKEIARKLEMEPKTVSNHVRTILKKTNAENRTKFAISFHRK